MPKTPSSRVNVNDLKQSPYWSVSGRTFTCLLCTGTLGRQLIFSRSSNAVSHATTTMHITKVMLADEQARSIASTSHPLHRSPNAKSPPVYAQSWDQPVFQSTSSHEKFKVTVEDDPEDQPFARDALDGRGLDTYLISTAEREEDCSDISLWLEGTGRGVIASWPDALELNPHAEIQKLLREGKPLFTMNFDSSPWEELFDELGDDGGNPEEPSSSGQESPFEFSGSDLPKANGDVFPWSSHAHLLTDALFNSPRLRFSREQRRAVLAWAKKLGAADVPSLHELTNVQHSILESIGNPTRKYVSSAGTVFYLNDLARSIAMDYANPITRNAMEDYPVDSGVSSSQVWNGTKMLFDVPSHLSTPTAQHNGIIYWVNEIIQLSNGLYFVPQRFYKEEISSGRRLMACGWVLRQQSDGLCVDQPSAEGWTLVPLSEFRGRSLFPNAHSANNPAPHFSPATSQFLHEITRPHPFRQKAGDKMVYGVPLLIFEDDVSGNVSKQWNKHFVVYMSNGNIPREMIDKEYCVRFVTSSPHASPMELMQGVKDNIEAAAREGIVAFDCRDGSEVFLIPYALFFPGDNPMQAELCSHSGLSCNYFCRTCHVGGTKAEKESNDGFQSLFAEGQLRTSQKTESTIQNCFHLATESGAHKKVDKIVSSGVRDSLSHSTVERVIEKGKELRGRGRYKGKATAKPENEIVAQLKSMLEIGASRINPLLSMEGVEIPLDTPTEILHTVLLGVVKYFWGQTIWIVKQNSALDTFRARLASLNSEGLNTPKINADYMCKYSGSLIGKHFKLIAQVMEFVVYDLVPGDVLQAWRAIGTLVVLLWHTTIEDIDEYLGDLRKAIDDFLNITAKCAPSILITKPKFHFLVHLPTYIQRFGPAIVFSTERYESFNSIFRLSCIHSNRQAPSRDSCEHLAYSDSIKHILSGGYWYSKANKSWVKAGPGVLKALEQSPEVQNLLGLYKPPSPIVVGAAKLHPAPARNKRPRRRAAGPSAPSVHNAGGAGSHNEPSGAAGDARINDETPTSQPQLPEEHTLSQDISVVDLRQPVRWSTTLCSRVGSVSVRNMHMLQAKAVVTGSGDTAQIGSHVIYRWTGESLVQPRVGRVVEILAPAGISHTSPISASHVCLVDMAFLGVRHPVLDLPCVEMTGTHRVLQPQDILCVVNLQHDCQGSGCNTLYGVRLRQERQLSDSTCSLVKHEPTGRFILNTNSLHNYQHIRDVIPTHLLGNSIAFEDVAQLRAEAATTIRLTKAEMENEKQEKAKKKEKKKKKAKGKGKLQSEDSDDEDNDPGDEEIVSAGKERLVKGKQRAASVSSNQQPSKPPNASLPGPIKSSVTDPKQRTRASAKNIGT